MQPHNMTLTDPMQNVATSPENVAAAANPKTNRITLKTLPHVTISPTISSTMPTSTMEFNEIVDDGPATRNDIVNDADVK